MDAALTHVGNTDSVSSMTPVYLMGYPVKYPINPNLLHRDLYSAACINPQKLSHCLCQVACHIPAVIRPAVLIRSCVNKP